MTPVGDYASNLWSHTYGSAAMAALNRVQRIGAQAITGVFRTVATGIGEAEASIPFKSKPLRSRSTCKRYRVRTRLGGSTPTDLPRICA